MNVCLISREYPEETGWGGIGAYTYEMAHELFRVGHQVSVISLALEKERHYTEAKGVTVHRLLPRGDPSDIPVLWRLNSVWPGHHLAIALQIHRLERILELDVVEAASIHGQSAIYQLGVNRTPVIVRLHSCTPKEIELNERDWHPSVRIGHFLEKVAVARAQMVTAPSRFIVRENKPHLPLSRKAIRVIPNPVNTQQFQPIQEVQPDLGVLFVGRLDVRKGIKTLIHAMKQVWQHDPDLPLTLVGSDSSSVHIDSMWDWITRRIRSHPGAPVRFWKWVSRKQMVTLYNRASVVVFPSLWEPFGYVCIEAMACGKPVIAACAGGPEEIIEDKITGFLVPPGNSQCLADIIAKVTRESTLRKAIGQAARDAILQSFDSRVVVEQMLKHYETVAE